MSPMVSNLSVTVDDVFEDMREWIQQTPDNGAPSSFLNAVPFKVLSMGGGFSQCYYGYGVLRCAEGRHMLSGDVVFIPDNVTFVAPGAWNGVPYEVPQVPVRVSLTRSQDLQNPCLTLSLGRRKASLTAAAGAIADSAVLSGTFDDYTHVQMTFAKRQALADAQHRRAGLTAAFSSAAA